VDAAEAEYRREFLPPPSRAKPFPDANAVAAAQQLERLARAIGALEASIQQQPVPENDRMTQRYRQEAATLKVLIEHDEKLVGQCELLRSRLSNQGGPAILGQLPDFEVGLAAIRTTLQSREAVLLDRPRA
jgi:hypothetical protein